MANICLLIKNLLKKNTTSAPFSLPVDKEKFVELIKKALKNDEFEVYYQPQYNYETKEMHGAEALVRWKCDDKENVSPAVFVPLLEKYGMIYEVDKVVWKKVCQDLKNWKKSGLQVPHLSVNISVVDLYQDDFEEYLLSLINEYQLKPENLHLEITETAYIKDLKFMVNIIKSLQQNGFIVEMDDFGSGYSSLKTLKNVPFDVIKLDMEFLQESEINEKTKNILTSVIDMLQKIKVHVIVEGVEHEEQAELLNRLGCSYMQGYYFGKPTNRENFEKILQK